jgi:hypothetical protein
MLLPLEDFMKTRITHYAVAVCLAMGGVASGTAMAQQSTAGTAALPPGLQVIEPSALTVIKAMSERLSQAKTIKFSARVQSQGVSIDNVTVFYMSETDFSIQRPNKLAARRTGEGNPTELIYDGKRLVGVTPEEPVIALADAPDNIDDMAVFAFEKAGIYFPSGVIILSNSYDVLTADLKAAFIVGTTDLVGGVLTNAVALAGSGVDGQFWVGVDDKLPRMITMVYTKEPNRPQVTIEFSDWVLDQPIDPSTFDTARFLNRPTTEFARQD